MDEFQIMEYYINACKKGYIDIVKSICSLTMSKEGRCIYYAVCGFQDACRNGHIDVAKFLLNTKYLFGRENTRKYFGCAIVPLCGDGNLEMVKYLLTLPEIGSNLFAARLRDGFVDACKYGHLEMVEYLLTHPDLNRHFNIRTKNDLGFQKACENGHSDVIDFLLHHKNFLADSLELCIEELGEQRVFKVLATLNSEQQNYFYESNNNFFNDNFDVLMPLYLKNKTQLPECFAKQNNKQEEIDILI